jgi:sugar phosphate isomerase/epimerase
MKLSTSSLHYRSLPLLDALRRISALGYEGVDIWAHFEWAGPLCEHLEEAVERSTPERFMETLRELKLTLNSASCYTVPFARFAPLLGACGGCVVVRGSQGVADENITGADLVREMKQFLESLKPDLELAEKYQCVLAVENHSGQSLLNKLESFKVFTDLNQNPRLGIALAPFHVQANKESVVDAITQAGSQLKFFYAWQYADLADEKLDKRLQLPGIGPTDMRPWLRALAAIDYAGFVNPFMHYEPEPAEMDVALKKSRQYMLSAATDIRQT